ncbi:Spy/CpxP family protein refolding chaperone [Sphingomonas sp. PB2P19]|uniref:Spy/CpxP family protein refolding chaperone n=1 Tax=Sphingomonas rhamnosi TaxID=3096156 RepID=UPI002FCA5EC0
MKRYAFLLPLALAAPAIAQQWPDGPPPPAEFIAAREHERDDLALVLGLSPQQRPALASFLAAEAPPEQPMTRPDPTQGFEQRLADREQHLHAREADEGKRIAAARTFYAALDSRQRLVFEAVMRLRGRLGGPRPHGPPPGHGPDQD